MRIFGCLGLNRRVRAWFLKQLRLWRDIHAGTESQTPSYPENLAFTCAWIRLAHHSSPKLTSKRCAMSARFVDGSEKSGHLCYFKYLCLNVLPSGEIDAPCFHQVRRYLRRSSPNRGEANAPFSRAGQLPLHLKVCLFRICCRLFLWTRPKLLTEYSAQ